MTHAPAFPVPQSDERNAATLAHLSVLSVFLGLPLGNILGPLIVLLVKRGESDFVVRHCKAALNLQITFCVTVVVTVLAAITLVPELGEAAALALIPLALLGSFLWLVFTIIGALRANSGEEYRCPLALSWL